MTAVKWRRWSAIFAVLVVPAGVSAGGESKEPEKVREPVVALLDSAAAWKKLPPAKVGKDAPLPGWARMLAVPLPNATAAMLEFDYIHRTRSPLEPKLRARLRWMIADANRCKYTKTSAQYDLEKAGASPAEAAALRRGDREGAWSSLAEREKAALQLVRGLTLRAADVTDEQFAHVLKEFGEEQTVAIVLLTAGANFQDRLFLTLGVPDEPDQRTIAPIAIAFDADVDEASLPEAPPRKPLDESLAHDNVETPGLEWTKRPLDDLKAMMELQKEKPPRIRVPTHEEFAAKTAKFQPKSAAAKKKNSRGVRVVWSLVCAGYQPELAAAWGRCTSAFRRDAKQDRVFEESLFWVVTRSIDCFY